MEKQKHPTPLQPKKLKNKKVNKVLLVLKKGYEVVIKVVEAINNIADFFKIFKTNKKEEG